MEIVPGINCISLPLPPGQGQVNCYLAACEKHWNMFDAGLHHPLVLAAMEQSMESAGLGYGDIAGLYISHCHPNHFGLAGKIQELSGAGVFMHRLDGKAASTIWKRGRTNIPVVSELIKENGAPSGLIAEISECMEASLGLKQPYPELSYISEGDGLVVGSRLFEVIHAPGHSDGHILFFSREDGVLIAGDCLVKSGSTKICLWPNSDPNPLDQYFKTLEKIISLPVRIVLPGHGEAFTGCALVAGELIRFHRERLDLVCQLAGFGKTAYEVCTDLYGTVLPLADIALALTETLAYLAYLESSSRVVSRQEGGIVRYRKIR